MSSTNDDSPEHAPPEVIQAPTCQWPPPGNSNHAGEKPHKGKKRRRKRKLIRLKPGTKPGTLLADPEAPKPVISVLAYSSGEFVEKKSIEISEIPGYLEHWKVTWINVNGLGDADAIRRLGEIFGLHRLALEDVINTNQRPKVDNYPNYLYIVSRAVNTIEPFDTDQVSIFLGQQYVLSFQEKSFDCYDVIRERLRESKGYIRKEGSGYLSYALLDAVIDAYFPALEQFSDQLEALEDRILVDPSRDILTSVHEIRRNLIVLRRAIWPMRETVNAIIRDANPLFGQETLVYMRDCYDHSVQIIDLMESYREVASDLMGVYLSSLGQKTNEIMKVLTLLSTIFMPLTFIVGIYGMNFNPESSPYNMPELNSRYGYPATMGAMALIAVCMIIYFYTRGWLSEESSKKIKPQEQQNGHKA